MFKLFLPILCLSYILILTPFSYSFAASLGPAETIDDLRAMIDEASAGDVLLVTEEISMDEGSPLTSHIPIRIASQVGETATLRALRLADASITFSNLILEDSLSISGISNICLSRGTQIRGSQDGSALSFVGSGTLIIEPGCNIVGAPGNCGVSISHTGGELYGSIEGSVSGGDGQNGGAGVTISPLFDSSAILISGSIRGGNGVSLGGQALNLHNLSGNAFITIDGNLIGGDGFIGGDGIHLISASDSVSVGIGGSIKGGTGQSYGGTALILMNASDSSSFNLSGSLSGGDAMGIAAQPGTSLQLVGNSSVVRTRIDNCILEEGRYLSATPKPAATPTNSPQPTSIPEPTPIPFVRPDITPLPEITAPASNIAYIITPEPPETIQP